MTQTQGAMSAPLDTNTLKELARVICGDDHLFYRRAFEIAHFLQNAGWRDVPDIDGESRAEWTLDRLLERRTQPSELEKVLLRLADAREYYDEPDQLPKVLAAVNTFLVHEGLRLENPGGRPRLVPCDPALAHPGQHAPVELKATMADIIADQRMAALLGRRLDEARTCFANGAHVAAVIMLGSLLEGVLLTAVQERDATLLGRKGPNNMNLGELIDICYKARWIDADVTNFSHALRDYRNFVHPHREFREAHTPDRDTLNVSWYVVNGALNDLAATRPS
ncbi:hypothetical protein [Streptomyces justiciae]|uniref:hypothetical protein n=1 Tax=Streptomyces justiciae TaxID=2780140 RepID=UPI001881BCCB|nr:hypothetical protein [Streptomyces justiciae]MBE8477387.1 hypothetical protein [Streptomyces justiciae]